MPRKYKSITDIKRQFENQIKRDNPNKIVSDKELFDAAKQEMDLLDIETLQVMKELKGLAQREVEEDLEIQNEDRDIMAELEESNPSYVNMLKDYNNRFKDNPDDPQAQHVREAIEKYIITGDEFKENITDEDKEYAKEVFASDLATLRGSLELENTIKANEELKSLSYNKQIYDAKLNNKEYVENKLQEKNKEWSSLVNQKAAKENMVRGLEGYNALEKAYAESNNERIHEKMNELRAKVIKGYFYKVDENGNYDPSKLADANEAFDLARRSDYIDFCKDTIKENYKNIVTVYNELRELKSLKDNVSYEDFVNNTKEELDRQKALKEITSESVIGQEHAVMEDLMKARSDMDEINNSLEESTGENGNPNDEEKNKETLAKRKDALNRYREASVKGQFVFQNNSVEIYKLNKKVKNETNLYNKQNKYIDKSTKALKLIKSYLEMKKAIELEKKKPSPDKDKIKLYNKAISDYKDVARDIFPIDGVSSLSDSIKDNKYERIILNRKKTMENVKNTIKSINDTNERIGILSSINDMLDKNLNQKYKDEYIPEKAEEQENKEKEFNFEKDIKKLEEQKADYIKSVNEFEELTKDTNSSEILEKFDKLEPSVIERFKEIYENDNNPDTGDLNNPNSEKAKKHLELVNGIIKDDVVKSDRGPFAARADVYVLAENYSLYVQREEIKNKASELDKSRKDLQKSIDEKGNKAAADFENAFIHKAMNVEFEQTLKQEKEDFNTYNDLIKNGKTDEAAILKGKMLEKYFDNNPKGREEFAKLTNEYLESSIVLCEKVIEEDNKKLSSLSNNNNETVNNTNTLDNLFDDKLEESLKKYGVEKEPEEEYVLMEGNHEFSLESDNRVNLKVDEEEIDIDGNEIEAINKDDVEEEVIEEKENNIDSIAKKIDEYRINNPKFAKLTDMEIVDKDKEIKKLAKDYKKEDLEKALSEKRAQEELKKEEALNNVPGKQVDENDIVSQPEEFINQLKQDSSEIGIVEDNEVQMEQNLEIENDKDKEMEIH